jgi:calcineurin-like phosphoesterase family protein
MKPEINIYVSSDEHFLHDNIIKFCNRPFKSVEEMTERLIKNWNQTVRPQDLIINLGDVIYTKGASEKIKEIIDRLFGRKILCLGNHDRKSMSFYLTNGFDFVCDRFVWEFNNRRILFLHNPNFIESADYRKYDFIIHGHRHNKGLFITKKDRCKIINVSCEQLNYQPINLLSLLNRRNNE